MAGSATQNIRVKRGTGTNHGASEPVPTICVFVLPTDGGQPLLVGWVISRDPAPGLRFGLGFHVLLNSGFPS